MLQRVLFQAVGIILLLTLSAGLSMAFAAFILSARGVL